MPKRKLTETLHMGGKLGSPHKTFDGGGPTLIDPVHEVEPVELDGVAVADMLGSVQHANAAFAAMHGYEAPELIGRSLESLHTTAQRTEARVFYDEARRNGHHEGELSRGRKGGGTFSTWSAASLIQGDGGDPEGLLVVARGLSRTPLGKGAGDEGEARRIIAAVPDGYVLCEVVFDAQRKPTDCRVLDANPAFLAMVGQPAGQIVGRTVSEVIPDTERSWIEACGLVSITGTPVRIESTSKKLAMSLEVLAFRPRKGQVACLFQDISERVVSDGGDSSQQQTLFELRMLIRQLVEQLEESRSSIAAVLQDRVRQNLAVLGMKLGMTQAFADQGDTSKIIGIVEHGIGQIGDMGDTVRAMLRSLRPRKLDKEGLFAALSWYAERTSKNTPLLVLVEGEPLPMRLPVEKELALFRITEAAIDNVLRHSGASRAHIGLAFREGNVILSIVDDGSGFDVSCSTSGVGLISIRERALAAGGNSEVESSIGRGTRVNVYVPVV